MPEPESPRLRRRLVRDLQRHGHVRSRAVRDAFLAVPRERFLPELAKREGLEAVYRDDAVPTKRGPSGTAISSSSQPAIMAEMLEELAVGPELRVLEVGAGTGYNAALLAELAGSVTTVDVDPEIARRARRALREGGHRVRVVAGDGRDGYAAAAPYDRIVVTASAVDVPRAWLDQLVEAGLLVVPLRVRSHGVQAVATFRREGSRFLSTRVVPGGFMPLRGAGEETELPPSLTASDSAAVGPLVRLGGFALATLAAPARRRLLALALAPGRRVPLGLEADAEALLLYLTFALPPSHAVGVLPGFTLGTIGRDGRSLAYVEGPRVPRRVRTLVAHGGRAAEERLLRAVARWDELGRPGGRELRLEVEPPGPPRLRMRRPR